MILYLDIETSPMEIRTWGTYEQNALDIVEEWYILGAAYAWDDGPVKAVYPKDVENWPHAKEENERVILERLWSLLDAADIVVAHNGDKFDLRKINARLVRAGLGPPSPYLTIDTLKAARRHFAFSQNRLDYLGRYLGLDGKLEHSGLALWLGCLDGNPKAWRTMKRYNKRDVELLRDVYKVLRPWISGHPHVGGNGCPKCESTDHTKRGIRRMKSGITYQQYQCNTCGGYHRARTKFPGDPQLRP